jgi:tritrans,polycis-undecaprenyl-diphosphate synthase [geranylgeranyl-diphosphate specific]
MFNDKRIDEDKVKINFIGRTWIFPKELQNIMQKLTDKTKDYNNFTVNFAMAYGGREEVIDAIKKLGEEIKNKDINIDDINEEVFAKNLYTDHEPELIIRTGGEKRTSNFLIWQSWYSEWIFLEKTFPEFEKQDLINAIENYSKRERRFGK